MDCAGLFTKVPTDVGLCCALNTENILKQSEYGDLVNELQLIDNANEVICKGCKKIFTRF